MVASDGQFHPLNPILLNDGRYVARQAELPTPMSGARHNCRFIRGIPRRPRGDESCHKFRQRKRASVRIQATHQISVGLTAQVVPR